MKTILKRHENQLKTLKNCETPLKIMKEHIFRYSHAKSAHFRDSHEPQMTFLRK